MKENEVELPPHTLYKDELSCIKGLNIRVKGVNLHNLGSGKGFLAVTSKAQVTTEKKKKDRWDGMKIKISCASNSTVNKVENNLQNRRKYIQIICDLGLVSRIRKQLSQIQTKKKKKNS